MTGKADLLQLIERPVVELALSARSAVSDVWAQIDEVYESNCLTVVNAFERNRVSSGLDYSTGYGYGSYAREAIDNVWADVLGVERALVRPQIVTGTQAIVACLRGLLKPGTTLLSITGRPYHTLYNAITGLHHSLCDSLGIRFREIVFEHGRKCWFEQLSGVEQDVKVVFIQRSRGYASRPALTIADIGEMIDCVREYVDAVVVVDNCYGEFVQDSEPTQVGADIIAGSLLKNPGGGLAPTGGYVAGKAELVEQIAAQLTAPGQGGEVGPLFSAHSWMLQGLFMAPGVVASSLKAAVWGAWIASQLGIEAAPRWDEVRGDIVQTLRLNSAEALASFCRGVQRAGPVDANAIPQGSELPGYDCDVIMAGGTFVQGSSIEFSADAPITEPYDAFVQGGICLEHAKLAYKLGLSQLIRDQHI